jgi:Cys-tRNA(Pro)/Cys-tRNA(Cys) deacylase
MYQSLMNIEDYLKENNIWHRFVEKQETIHTADASHATGIELHRITKNLVAITDAGENVILIIPGDRRVNLKDAAKSLGAKNLKLMPFDQSEKISGYPPGGTPSLGFKTKVRVVVDKELESFETFYCGGGSRDRLLEIRFADVVRFNNSLVATVSN